MIALKHREHILGELIWRDRPAWIPKRKALDVIDRHIDDATFWSEFWPDGCLCLAAVVVDHGGEAVDVLVGEFWDTIERRLG